MALFAPTSATATRTGSTTSRTSAPTSPRTATASRTTTAVPTWTTTATGCRTPQDKCPNEAEDVDQFEDDDGCPEARQRQGRHPRPQRRLPQRRRGRRGQAARRTAALVERGHRRRRRQRRHRQVRRRARGPRRLPGRRRLPRHRQRRRRHPRQLRQLPQRGRGCRRLRGRRRLPDPDNDKDGFPDAADRCPAQPETLNGNKDDDGCPDPGAELVRLTDNTHRAGRADRLRQPRRPAAADPGLAEVAQPGGAGHEGTPGDRDGAHRGARRRCGQRQTQERADAVRAFLVSKGVPAPPPQGGGGRNRRQSGRIHH